MFKFLLPLLKIMKTGWRIFVFAAPQKLAKSHLEFQGIYLESAFIY
jgi:hypothetical protein